MEEQIYIKVLRSRTSPDLATPHPEQGREQYSEHRTVKFLDLIDYWFDFIFIEFFISLLVI